MKMNCAIASGAESNVLAAVAANMNWWRKRRSDTAMDNLGKLKEATETDRAASSKRAEGAPLGGSALLSTLIRERRTELPPGLPDCGLDSISGTAAV
jgi:hypothetical protein